MTHVSAHPPSTLQPRAHADTAFYREILHEVIEIGADVARMVRAQSQALAEASAQPEADPFVQARAAERIAAAYDRVARAIRRSIAQARRLDEPLAASRGGTAKVAAGKRLSEMREDELAKLSDEELDRLEAAEAAECENLLLDRPIEQAVAAICRDLDLASVATLDESAVARLRAVVEWIVHRAEDAAVA